jgi:hypothetical protein
MDELIDFVPEPLNGPWTVACFGANAPEFLEHAVRRGEYVAIRLADHARPEFGDGKPEQRQEEEVRCR